MIDKKLLVEYTMISSYQKQTKEMVKQLKKETEERIQTIQKSRQYEEKEKELSKITEKIESSALKEFKETSNKKLTGGLGIREINVYDYDDSKALAWAKEHDMCLSLDKKAFNSLMKNQNFGFVKKDKSLKITWPVELKLED